MCLIYDVLIIGNGGAGLSAALEAKKYSSNVIVVSKTYPTSSQTCQAQGGINTALDSNKNSVHSHIADTKDQIAQRNFGGATIPRTCYSSDYTGLKILHT
jgi:NADH-dependent fumarate reductase subunit A